MTYRVWNVNRARPSASDLPLRLARSLAQKLEDKYHQSYVVVPSV